MDTKNNAGLICRPPASDLEACRNLLAGVLSRALLDIAGVADISGYENKIEMVRWRKRHRDEAIDWINDDEFEEATLPEFSFLWICEQLDIDPSGIRQVADRLAGLPIADSLKPGRNPTIEDWINRAMAS